MASLQSEAQSLSPDNFVVLFALDTSSIGGPVLYFTPDKSGAGQPVIFNGIAYTPTDVEFAGLETSGQGALPNPTIKVRNVQDIWQALLNTYGSITGCTLIRLRTHKRFLDDGADADPLAVYGPDMFLIERLSASNPVFLQWDLSASIDQQGVKLPRRTVTRDTCMFRYRSWRASTHSFDYSKSICPYAEDAYFDINDQPVTDPALDVPSRRKSCCTTRFGADNPLPFGGFPGTMRSA